MIMGFKKRGDIMKPKLGRPTDNPKRVSVHVRIDKECEDIIERYSKQENISRMEAVRRGIKKLKPDIKK